MSTGLIVGIIGLILCFLARRLRTLNRSATRFFALWLSEYISVDRGRRNTMAKSFSIESISAVKQLAPESMDVWEAIEKGLTDRERPTAINKWLGAPLDHVKSVFGDENVATMPARTVGALLLIGLNSANPVETLQRLRDTVLQATQ